MHNPETLDTQDTERRKKNKAKTQHNT